MKVDFQEQDSLKQWKDIFIEEKSYYIYGAANSARQILEFAEKTDVLSYIKGCVVSNGKENETCLCGMPVYDIHFLMDTNAIILVPHTGVYKREICMLLEDLGYKNIVLIHKYVTSLMKNQIELPDDIFMEKANTLVEQIARNKTDAEKKLDEQLCERISNIRKEKQPDFGEDKFYQSMESIGLGGKRPTLYRIEKYKLKEILGKEKKVLDIGCNTGFIDITISPLVKTVLGIEYDAAMVEIANAVKEYLTVKNCCFCATDFNEWIKKNDSTFDVILSFAIHHWLNIEPEIYVQILDGLLNPSGYICMESHDLVVSDEKFDECVALLYSKGYREVLSGNIKDDGVTERAYKILQKL